MQPTQPAFPTTAEGWNERSQGRLPGHIDIRVTAIGPGFAEGEIAVRPYHMAPNGFLHAATVIGLADTLAGYGCVASLPEGATGFTTMELKSNFLGTTREGTIRARATLLHGGRMTQVWDAEVVDGGGKPMALFRCTQMVLYPRG